MNVASSRRNLLLGLAIGPAIAAIGSSPLPSHPAYSGYPGKLSRYLFLNVEAAAAIGRRHLARHPEEADIGLLLQLLRLSRRPAPAAARRVIAAQRMMDFRAGHLTNIEGWLLARTEARACALAALA